MLWSTSVSHFSRHPCHYKSSRPRRSYTRHQPVWASFVSNASHRLDSEETRPSQSVYKRGSAFHYITVKVKEQNVSWTRWNRSSFPPLCPFQPAATIALPYAVGSNRQRLLNSHTLSKTPVSVASNHWYIRKCIFHFPQPRQTLVLLHQCAFSWTPSLRRFASPPMDKLIASTEGGMINSYSKMNERFCTLFRGAGNLLCKV